MKRRTFLHSAIAIGASTVAATSASGAARQIGSLTAAQFEKANKDGAKMVSAIKASANPLSKDDQELLTEMADGGMMQLQLSQLASTKATSADVKAIAMAEVKEQQGLSAKLTEIAAAKGLSLPKSQSEKTAKMYSKLEQLSGSEFDRAYLKQSGVEGHELLMKTMQKAQRKAEDANLKEVATVTLPLIETHLTVSQEEVKEIA